MSSPAALNRQLRRAERALADDPLLAPLIARFGRCRLRCDTDRGPYAALIESVVYQQLNGRAAETIFNRLLALYPRSQFPSPRQLLRTPEEKLRAAGLSRQKIAALYDIAARTHAGELPRERDEIDDWEDEQIITALTAARGVGRWTAEMVLIFTLGRLDVWPVDDYGVRVGYARAAGLDELPSVRQLRELGAAWSPWRSVAAWYCWQLANAEPWGRR
jgi:DNA-3-methyladenine glycosylase II